MNSYRDFIDELQVSRPGERIVYHIGMLARQRDPFGTSNAPDWNAIGEVAWAVAAPKGFTLAARSDPPLRCGGLGAADLTQNRIEAHKYEYQITLRRALTAAEIGDLRAKGAAAVKETRRIRGLE